MATAGMLKTHPIKTELEQRVLIAAPTGADAELLRSLLNGAGIETAACATLDELCREIQSGAAAAILAEEVLSPAPWRPLIETLLKQPEWSDFPLIVMAADPEAGHRGWRLLVELEGRSHAVLLQRPVRKVTLLTAVRAAIQSRTRQYQVRDELVQRRRAEEALRQSERRLATLVANLPGMAYRSRNDQHWTVEFVSAGVTDITGYNPIDFTSGRIHWRELLHPDDVERVWDAVQSKVQLGRSYQVEYRIRHRDGSWRWVLEQGEAVREDDAGPAALEGFVSDITERKESEETLRRAHGLIEGITKGTHDQIAAVDRDFRFLYFNEAYRREYNSLWNADIAVGTNLLEPLASWPAEQQKARELWSRALGGESVAVTMDFGPSEDEKQFYDLNFNPVRDSEGRLIGAAHILRNVTDQVRMHQAVRNSEERQRIAADAAGLGVFEWNIPDDNAIWENERMYEIFGHSRDDGTLTRTQFLESYLHPDDLRIMQRASVEGVKPGARLHTVCRIRRKSDGDLRWVEFAGNFSLAADGTPLKLVGVVADVTERMQAEHALRESDERFRLLADAAPVLIWLNDEHNRCEYVNAEYVRFTGRALHELLGAGWSESVHPDDFEGYYGAFLAAAERGELFEADFRFRRADGEFRWMRTVGVPRFEGSTYRGYVGSTSDIHERKRAEEALRESEKRFRAMADTAPAMLWVTEPSGSCTFLSRGWYEYTGQTEEQALGRGWLDALHPDDRDESSHIFQSANEQREAFALDCRVRRADGEYRWTIGTGRPRFGSDGEFQGFVGSVIDVHERKQVEETLRDSEERFRTMADNISQFAWMADASGWIFWYNRRWYDYTGTTLEEMQGWGWKKVHHPDHVDRVVERIQRSWDTGEVWEDLFPLRGKDGNYRWFLSRALPIQDERGNVVRWFGTNTDVTEQRAAEEALKEADRRKDEFLATLAHELRNPLAPIRTGLELMKLIKDDPAILEETRQTMERQTQQLITLVDDLLDVSRITQGKLELRKCEVRLSDVVESAVEASRPFIDEAGHELAVDLPGQPVLIDGDPNRLAQVLSNLLNNAAKYTPQGGQIRLSARREGDEVVLSVKDTGIGIPADKLESIFEMFAQIDRPQERGYTGLGIGLTLVRSLVAMHGGSVEVHSEGVDRGSTFGVRLPVLEQRPIGDDWTSSDGESELSHSKRRVLVVDDNKAAAEMLRMVVRMLGNEVQTAGDGQEAVERAAVFQPDVVLMDLGMPRMNGYQAARHIRQQPWGEAMVLVALTGWGQSEDKQRTSEAGFDHHLVKPAEPADLQRLFSQLDQQSSPSVNPNP